MFTITIKDNNEWDILNNIEISHDNCSEKVWCRVVPQGNYWSHYIQIECKCGEQAKVNVARIKEIIKKATRGKKIILSDNVCIIKEK